MLFTLLNIEKKVNSHNIILHPFLEKLRNGGYSKEQIKIFVTQQFYFSNQFPRCLGALWCRISDHEISLPLMKFLTIEHWGSSEQGAHWTLYEKVLAFFDLTINELKASQPFDETKTYLDFRFDLCLNGTVEEGLGCMGFAHELVNEKIFKSYYDGVKSIANVPDSALNYFKSHVEDEPEDYRIFKNIIQKYVTVKDKLELVEKGALDTLSKRELYFDRMKVRLDRYSDC
jgi:pyrroloquinoline quinone (PQQ) biosynthesis protein C